MAATPLFLLLAAALVTSWSSLPSSRAEARPAFACGGEFANLPFCRKTMPIHNRVKDLILRLTLEEKIRLLVNNAAGVPRLGISGYEWWSEALHGVSNVGPGTRFGRQFPGATSFPQVILTAAAFNASLWEDIGKVVSDEARAMYNGGQAGLTFWSPNVNIFRDPRWGRGQETPGEDPLIAAAYASAYVRGLQQPYGYEENRLKLAACCKHYTAYDLDNWGGTDRFHFNARVTKQDLEDTFDVPFKSCVVEGKVASVMCSYNQVDGVPTCADRGLLLDTIRGEWGLNGYIVSDCDSVGVFFNAQHYTTTPEDAAADAIKAGLDLDCGPFLAQYTGGAVAQGKVPEVLVDYALANTITVQMRLGMFDGDPSEQPFGQLGPADVCSPAHQSLAKEAALQGIVLLKNDAAALPLSVSRHLVVAVVGPNSAATTAMIGNYAGLACGYTSTVDGIARYAKVVHRAGCYDVGCGGSQPIDEAVAAARESDATVLVMGLDQSQEAEMKDREHLLLPGRQQELVVAIAAAASGPVVLVLMSGGPLDVSFAKNDPKIAAILWVGYPGQAGGSAIADVLFGAHNPGGKLPTTWYPQEFASRVPMTDMAMRADRRRGYPGRSYRFYDGPVVYPFGHGLSYAVFSHSVSQSPSAVVVPISGRRSANASVAVRVARTRCEDLQVEMLVEVENKGDRGGAETVLVFASPPKRHGAAIRQLVGFEKVQVAERSKVQVRLGIDVCKHLSFADRNGIRRIAMGEHVLHVGDKTQVLSLAADHRI
ncbi:putative beta-D-xylosidase 2 [Wolffia australiana]